MNSALVWTLLINYHGFGFFSLMDAFVVLKKIPANITCQINTPAQYAKYMLINATLYNMMLSFFLFVLQDITQ